MPAVEIGVSEILSIITHIKKWVTNLLRAKKERKKQSKEALEAVILAIIETQIYLGDIKERGKKAKSKKIEKNLALLWTGLSLKVRSIKLEKLAASCKDLGKYWVDPSLVSKDFIEGLKCNLSEVEKLAENILDQI